MVNLRTLSEDIVRILLYQREIRALKLLPDNPVYQDIAKFPATFPALPVTKNIEHPQESLLY